MTETQFNQLAAEGYNRIPLVLETFADLDTPLSVYLKLANQPHTYLLESVVGGERFGRYSFIGLAADTRIEVRGHECSEYERGKLEEPRAPRRSARSSSSSITRASRRRRSPDCRASAAGSSAISATTPCATSSGGSPTCTKPDPLGVPDILLLLSEELAVVDNLSGKLSLIVYADPARAGAYRAGARAIGANCCAKLRAPVAIPPDVAGNFGAGACRVSARPPIWRRSSARSTTSSPATSCRSCSSQRMSQALSAPSPLSLYRALRSLNPSPYMFYFDFGDFHVVGASPEILVRREGDSGHAAADRRHAAARRNARAKTRRSPPSCWPTRRSAPST